MSQVSRSFDVLTVLFQLDLPHSEPLPAPQTEHEIVLRMPYGITLNGLRRSPVGRQLMQNEGLHIWYERYDSSDKALRHGIYRLNIPVPGSYCKTFSEQQALLAHGEAPAPIVLVAAALLCFQQSGLSDPLEGKSTRCAELIPGGGRFGVNLRHGRLSVEPYIDESRYGKVGLSSVRNSP